VCKPDLTIVVVNYNTRELLRQCLASIREHSRELSCEVFVVDNASKDGSAEMVASAFPGVHLIANDSNVGFAVANNQALRQMTGRYALILNPDTLILPATLSRMVSFMDTTPDAAAAGCRIDNALGKLHPSYRRFMTLGRQLASTFGLLRVIPRWFTYRYTEDEFPTPHIVDLVWGAFLMIRRDVLDSVGLLDERFFLYCEEEDFCYRLAGMGLHVYYVPDVKVIHYGGESTRLSAVRDLFNEQAFLEQYRSYFKLMRKHHGGLYAGLFVLAAKLGCLRRFVGLQVLCLLGRSRRVRVASRLRAYSRVVFCNLS